MIYAAHYNHKQHQHYFNDKQPLHNLLAQPFEQNILSPYNIDSNRDKKIETQTNTNDAHGRKKLDDDDPSASLQIHDGVPLKNSHVLPYKYNVPIVTNVSMFHPPHPSNPSGIYKIIFMRHPIFK